MKSPLCAPTLSHVSLGNSKVQWNVTPFCLLVSLVLVTAHRTVWGRLDLRHARPTNSSFTPNLIPLLSHLNFHSSVSTSFRFNHPKFDSFAISLQLPLIGFNLTSIQSPQAPLSSYSRTSQLGANGILGSSLHLQLLFLR